MSKNQRPGMVTFAGIVMFLVAGFHGLIAISEFTQSDWLADIPLGLFSSSYLLWGFIDAILALIAIYTGYAILKGNLTGRYLGYAVAVLSAMRWFMILPAAPVMGLIIIVLDIIVLYGLSSNDTYFY
jgi:hypothetical protein